MSRTRSVQDKSPKPKVKSPKALHPAVLRVQPNAPLGPQSLSLHAPVNTIIWRRCEEQKARGWDFLLHPRIQLAAAACSRADAMFCCEPLCCMAANKVTVSTQLSTMSYTTRLSSLDLSQDSAPVRNLRRHHAIFCRTNFQASAHMQLARRRHAILLAAELHAKPCRDLQSPTCCYKIPMPRYV